MMNETSNSLHVALKEPFIEKKKLKVMEIIANGANLNERNEHLETPLHVAITQGLEDIAEVLIKKLPVETLNTICRSGFTPLYLAVWKNNFKIAQLLLKHGASASRDSFVKNLNLISPLQVAFHFENYSMINLLLEHITEVSLSEASEITELSLEWAIEQDYGNIVQWIVVNGGRYISNKSQCLVLKWVKNLKIADALLKKFHGRHLIANFQNAVQFEMHGIVENCIKNDPSLVNSRDMLGETYLHKAARIKIPKTIEIMIKNGFDVNAKNLNNLTPLHVAQCGASIKVLIDYGANIYAKSTQGIFPFEVALTRNNTAPFKTVVMNM